MQNLQEEDIVQMFKFSNPGDPLVLCSIETGRHCWNTYHLAREYDVASSRSQAGSQEIEDYDVLKCTVIKNYLLENYLGF